MCRWLLCFPTDLGLWLTISNLLRLDLDLDMDFFCMQINQTWLVQEKKVGRIAVAPIVCEAIRSVYLTDHVFLKIVGLLPNVSMKCRVPTGVRQRFLKRSNPRRTADWAEYPAEMPVWAVSCRVYFDTHFSWSLLFFTCLDYNTDTRRHVHTHPTHSHSERARSLAREHTRACACA